MKKRGGEGSSKEKFRLFNPLRQLTRCCWLSLVSPLGLALITFPKLAQLKSGRGRSIDRERTQLHHRKKEWRCVLHAVGISLQCRRWAVDANSLVVISLIPLIHTLLSFAVSRALSYSPPFCPPVVETGISYLSSFLPPFLSLSLSPDADFSLTFMTHQRHTSCVCPCPRPSPY